MHLLASRSPECIYLQVELLLLAHLPAHVCFPFVCTNLACHPACTSSFLGFRVSPRCVIPRILHVPRTLTLRTLKGFSRSACIIPLFPHDLAHLSVPTSMLAGPHEHFRVSIKGQEYCRVSIQGTRVPLPPPTTHTHTPSPQTLGHPLKQPHGMRGAKPNLEHVISPRTLCTARPPSADSRPCTTSEPSCGDGGFETLDRSRHRALGRVAVPELTPLVRAPRKEHRLALNAHVHRCVFECARACVRACVRVCVCVNVCVCVCECA